MNQNQTSRYFKYAIGEIILVVIGILIALQINNWNEERKNDAKIESYILAYKTEIEHNILSSKREINYAETFIEENIKTLKIRNFDSIHVDSLEQSIETFYIIFDADKYAHETFKNSQIADFGKYDSIINNIQAYYTWTYTILDDALKQHNSSVDKADNFWRFEQDKYELSYAVNKSTTLQSDDERKQNIVELIRSPKARNILKTDIRQKRYMIGLIKEFRAYSVRTLEKINQVL